MLFRAFRSTTRSGDSVLPAISALRTNKMQDLPPTSHMASSDRVPEALELVDDYLAAVRTLVLAPEIQRKGAAGQDDDHRGSGESINYGAEIWHEGNLHDGANHAGHVLGLCAASALEGNLDDWC